MTRRILRTGLIITVETALLLLLAATWGIPGEHRPAASTGSDAVLSFEQSMRTSADTRGAYANSRLID